MKKNLLLLSAAVALSANVYAQDSKLSVARAEIEAAPNSWAAVNENTFSYTGGGIISSDTWQEATAANPALHNVRRYSYSNNGSGQVTTTVFETWDATTNQWTKSTRSLYTYNPAGLVSNVATSEWNAGMQTWGSATQDSSFTYVNGKISTMTARFDDGSGLTNSDRVAYTYLTNGKVEKTVHTAWNRNTNAWTAEDMRTTFAYDAAGRLTQKTQNNYDYAVQVWYVVTEDNYTYDAMGKKTMYLRRVAEPNVPIYNFFKEEYTAHNANLQYTIGNTFVFDKDANVWNSFLRNTYTYETFVATEGAMVDTNFGMVFPNPAAERVTFRLNAHPNQPTRVQIYNAVGILMQTNDLKQQETTLSLEDLPSGMYIARIIQGGASQSIKLQVVR
jgi:Secretion system C-terminal sorting domain/Family of unknown function (DUF3836)